MARYADNDLLNAVFWWTNCGSYTQYTAITSATTLTAPALGVKVMLQNTSTLDIRYRTDGGDPTTSVGFLLRKDDGPRVIPINLGDTLVVIGAEGAILETQWGKVS